MRRLGAWAKVEKLAQITDLLSKLFLATAALAALSFFLQQPNVTLETRSQAFLDENTIRPLFGSSIAQLPPERRDLTRKMLEGLIEEYNVNNGKDLDSGRNTTTEKASVADLCVKTPREVFAVFMVQCGDPTVTNLSLGRGRSYERRLLTLNYENGSPLSHEGLRSVLKSLQAGEYRRARCLLKNIGNAKAINVSIRPSDGYFRTGGRANDPFTLKAGESDFVREFETDRGALERDPRLQFGVDWANAPRPDALNFRLLVLIGFAIAVIFLVFLLNDIRTTEHD